MDDSLALELGADILGAVPDVFVNADGYKRSISAPGIGNYITLGKAAALVKDMLGETALKERTFLHAHGTSTPAGDITELKAVREAFEGAGEVPVIGSTKSLSGHSLGAAGVQEAIYSLLMQQRGFIAASANIETLDPEAEGMPIARERVVGAELTRVMSNSFGFGGTNASLVFQALRD